MKTENLKNMYKDLADGYTVNVNGCTIFRGEGRDGKNYLFFQHYGSSATRVNMQNLRFICSVIAESKDFNYIVETPGGWCKIEKANKAGNIESFAINKTNVLYYDVLLKTGETVVIKRLDYDYITREKQIFTGYECFTQI